MKVAKAVLDSADADFQRLQMLFGDAVVFPSVTVIVAPLSSTNDGTGGAYHQSCDATDLYCDADFTNPDRTRALFIAELSEVGQATQNLGWDCGATNGEGLSRVHAEVLFPGVLDDFETASAWLDSSRPDWISQNENTDQDEISNGCAVLFLHWLHYLGYGYDRITQAGGSSLASTYQTLTGHSAPWPNFVAAVNDRWPVGTPSGVTTDNPWGVVPPPPNPPPQPPPSSLPTLTLASPLPAGTYVLTPNVSSIHVPCSSPPKVAVDVPKLVQALKTLPNKPTQVIQQ
ncbi:MAG: hypothetical protein KGL39_00380 [Patescibacteria group bacterium]|nr:hypothetical protein [Patescibacteria group bacterium]